MTPATAAYRTRSSATFTRNTLGAQREPVLVAMKPYDGSDAVLELAQWLAAEQERALHAISVVEPHEMVAVAGGVPLLPDRGHSEERSAITEALQERISRVPGARGTAGRVDVVDGPAAHTVADVARERGVHAIVVGTGQHGPLGRLVYGERAVQIARLSDRPVVVVPPNAKAGPVSAAIVAVDFSRALRARHARRRGRAHARAREERREPE